MIYRKLLILVAATSPLVGIVSTSFAADPPDVKAADVKALDQQGKKAHDVLIRSSDVIGMNVYNHQNQKLGDIDDIVLDGSTNRVSYVVLSRGGVLGIGDKLFAIPWSALEYRHLEPKKLFLNMDDNTLKNAPGFDKKTWPDMADATFRESLTTFYGNQIKERTTALGRDATITDTTVTGDKVGPEKKGLLWARRVSAIKNADVKNPAGEKLGDIEDLVLDVNNQKVRYAVLSHGGILGIGDKLFAIPMSSLQTDANKQEFVLNISKDHLKNAPGFNKQEWPNFADAQFQSNVDRYYGIDSDKNRDLNRPNVEAR
jgi:sporulation protein YlmC with PRC-barrel domain